MTLAQVNIQLSTVTSHTVAQGTVMWCNCETGGQFIPCFTSKMVKETMQLTTAQLRATR